MPETLEEAEERRDQPGFLGKIRTRSTSRTRLQADTDLSRSRSTSSTGGSFLSRMTSSEATTQQGQQHHHGALDKLKGVFSNRPSSRDRFSGKEDGSERNSLRTVQTGGTTIDGERGRNMHKDGDYIVSTGRGGAGNLRAASRTRAADAVEPSEDELRERSRERSRERGLVGGRGGAGNFRSASKQPADRIREQREEEEAEQAERAAQEKRAAAEANHFHSHGRGGAGNISRDPK